MARNELIEAYQNGRISRRTFVRGMMALGVSASVAVSLADGVRAMPGRQSDVYEDDVYELPDTGVGTTSGDSWLKPMAVLGAGAALIAGGLRRVKGATSAAE